MEARDAAMPTKLNEALKADHEGLEKTFLRVLGKFRSGDPDAIRACWLALDADLEAHLKAEEQFILPKFERDAPDAAARILREHQEIRAALDRLGVDLDLHALGEEQAARFIQRLEEHAAYEESVLYQWAESHLSQTERASVLERLRSVVLQAVRPGEKTNHAAQGK